jgi:hypothetical protein
MTESEEQSLAAELFWSLVDRNGPFPPSETKDQSPVLGLAWWGQQRGAWTVSISRAKLLCSPICLDTQTR